MLLVGGAGLPGGCSRVLAQRRAVLVSLLMHTRGSNLPCTHPHANPNLPLLHTSQRVPGVTATSVGYAQGHVENPTYRQVCSRLSPLRRRQVCSRLVPLRRLSVQKRGCAASVTLQWHPAGPQLPSEAGRLPPNPACSLRLPCNACVWSAACQRLHPLVQGTVCRKRRTSTNLYFCVPSPPGVRRRHGPHRGGAAAVPSCGGVIRPAVHQVPQKD